MMPRADAAGFAAAARSAAVAELVWPSADGTVAAAAVVPLVDGTTVTFALPFADTATAASLDAVDCAAVVLSDPRLARAGWTPVAATGQVTVEADRRGDWAQRGLLDQELRKFPPARALIDTPLLRREHWWYVSRWIVRLTDVGRVHGVGRREQPDHAVLAYRHGGRVDADTVLVDGWDWDVLLVTSLSGRHADGVRTAATVFTHDFSVPDREVASALALHGRLDGDRFAVAARHGERTLPRHPRLAERLRRQRDLGRRCRAALEAAGG